MREFKFRAFDYDKKVMIYDFDQNINNKGYNLKLGSSIHLLVYQIGLHYKTLMQYAGLKDINGKEIYEGDILKCQYCGGNGEYYINVIKWCDLDLSWSFANSPLWTWENIVILGNLYENPELI